MRGIAMSCFRAFSRMRVFSVVAVLATLVGVVTTVLAQSRSRSRQHLLKIDGEYQPVRGMNLPWLNGCHTHDFGHSPKNPEWGVGFTETDLDKYFADKIGRAHV